MKEIEERKEDIPKISWHVWKENCVPGNHKVGKERVTKNVCTG